MPDIYKSDYQNSYPSLQCKLFLLFLFSGQHDDARMAISLAITAIRHGAYCLNYTRVESLLKTCVDGNESICGARVRNTLTGRTSIFVRYLKLLANVTVF